MVIFGQSVFQRSDGLDFYKLANKISQIFIKKIRNGKGLTYFTKTLEI